MAAFVIVDVKVNDPVRYEDYKKMAHPTVAAHGGRYVARGGKVEVLEGDWPTGRFVILEFPSAARAREWWDSEDYRPAKALRHATASTKMILVEGV
jgi:uncharacterized protein (DUF1330 family)